MIESAVNAIDTGENRRGYLGVISSRQTTFVDLVASPITTFSTLHAIYTAVRRHPGVKGVQAIDFYKDVLEVRLACSDPSAPISAIMGLSRLDVRLVSWGASSIKVTVQDPN